MEDFKVVIYVILLIFYFIYQLIKGKGKGTQLPNENAEELPPPQEYKAPQPPKRAMQERSIQRMEREKPHMHERNIERMERGRTPHKETVSPKKTFTFDDILEEVEQNKPRRKPLPPPEPLKKPELEVESIKDEHKRTHKKYKSVGEFVRKEELAPKEVESSYKHLFAMLRSPQGARDAFILGEIFNRKY